MADAASQENGSSWIRDPTEEQQRYCELLGDFYQYELNNIEGLWILHRKVGYAIYGIPDEESKCENGHTGYNVERYKTIKAVVDAIWDVNKKKKNEKDQLDMAIVFVFVQYEEQLLQYPVFRILLTETTCKYVDTDRRVYSSWKDFLKSNELPEGKFCWPLNGIYSVDAEGHVELEWGVTPAAKIGKKVINAADKASGVAALGGTALCVVGAAVAAAPVLAAASTCSVVVAGYTVVRSSAALIDRGIHCQTVNPFSDRKAAASWLSVAGSAVGMAAGAVTSKVAALAKSGEAVGKARQITCTALNFTALTVNGTGIGFGYFILRERMKQGEVTPLEVCQFTASVLFFAHATVNFQTASQIIQENQKGVIENFEKSLRSNRHRKEFRKLAKNTAKSGENVMESNAKIIKSIRNIDNKDDFFAGMVRTRKDFGGQKAVFSENGNIIVNGGAEIHPMKLYGLSKQQRKEFFTLAKQASQGTISDAALRARFESVLNTSTAGSSAMNTSSSCNATQAEHTLTTWLQQGIEWVPIGRIQVMIICTVVNELTDLVCTKIKNKCAKWWHLIWHHVSELFKEACNTWVEGVNLAKELNNFIHKDRFNLKHGINMLTDIMGFVDKVYNRYKDHIEDLINDVKKLKVDDEICPICNKPT